MMFGYLLVGICLALTSAATDVTIHYSPPILTLLLPDTVDGEITGVTFTYGIKNVLYRKDGVRTSRGWECQVKGVQLDGADGVHAEADVYHSDGTVYQTHRATLVVEDSDRNSLKARLPSRRIRGAVAFRDDFNTLDRTQWKPQVSMYGGYNGEFQVYTNDKRNSFIRDGKLYIKPTLTTSDPLYDDHYLHHGVMDMKEMFGTCTNSDRNGCHREGKDGLLPPVWSARMTSKASIKYGEVEVRARIPTGDWLWPAIWMMPTKSKYGSWPRSGELDIMESRGNAGKMGVGMVLSTLHWGPDAIHRKMTSGRVFKDPTWADDFHTYKLVWTPSNIVISVDDKQILYVDPGNSFWEKGGFTGKNLWADGGKMAPFDQEFAMILNVAVGGTVGMFNDKMANKPWKNNSPTALADFWKGRDLWLKTWVKDDVAMIIDYVEMRNMF